MAQMPLLGSWYVLLGGDTQSLLLMESRQHATCCLVSQMVTSAVLLDRSESLSCSKRSVYRSFVLGAVLDFVGTQTCLPTLRGPTLLPGICEPHSFPDSQPGWS